MSYTTLLFDLDNTLVDFSASERRGLNEVYATYFKNLCKKSDFVAHYQIINQSLWNKAEHKLIDTKEIKNERFRLLTKQLKVEVDYFAIAEHYETVIGQVANWYPKVKATLQILKQKFRLGVITNGLVEVQQMKYQHLGFDKLCDCFIISEAVGISKPNQAIFNLALQQLNSTASQALMIGDSLSSDYQGAINAGLDFCWVNHKAALLPSHTRPKYIVNSVTELKSLLIPAPASLQPAILVPA